MIKIIPRSILSKNQQILKKLESGARQADFPFQQIARAFRMIESEMVPVTVPWNSLSEKLIETLRYAIFPGGVLRRLQPYIVQIYAEEFNYLKGVGAIEMIQERYAVLASLMPYYGNDCGLRIEEVYIAPEDLIF